MAACVVLLQGTVKCEKASLMTVYKKSLTDHARLAAASRSSCRSSAARPTQRPGCCCSAGPAAAGPAAQDLQQQVPQLHLPPLVLLSIVTHSLDNKQQLMDSLLLDPGFGAQDTGACCV